MKFPRDTYIHYNVFCKTVVVNCHEIMSNAKVSTQITTILLYIARILGISILGFVTISLISSLGMIAYFGSIGALLAANPILGGILIGGSALGLAGIIRLFWRQREVTKIVKETVVDRYKGDLDFLVKQLRNTDTEIPEQHIIAIENLVNKASIDLLNGLIKIGKLSQEDWENISRLLTSQAKSGS